MTVSMRVMSAGDGVAYLLRSVVSGDGDRSLATPLTRYYTEAGTPPGMWLGSGVAEFGDGSLAAGDTVTARQLELLLGQGRDPVTGAPLGRPYPRYEPVAARVAARVAALDPALGILRRAGEVARIEGEETARGSRRAVAGFDLTFSVPKSVSVLWGVADAGTQAVLVEAHHAAVEEVVGFFEREVAGTRMGADNGTGLVARVDVAGVAATAYDHYDSRAGDPQLHTHVVVSNKVKTATDGKWRSLDSRQVHASVVALSEHYNAVLADRLTGTFGLAWERRSRPGADRNDKWELTGVPEDLIAEFSSRTRDIDVEVARQISEYVTAHGRAPSRTRVIRLRAQATLATRPDKEIRSLADLTADWRARACHVLGTDPTGWARNLTSAPPARVLTAADVDVRLLREAGERVVATVAEKRSTWRHWNLWAEAARVTVGWRFATAPDREQVLAQIVDAAETASVALTPAEVATVPAGYARSDGSSVFRPKHGVVYSSTAVLGAEDRLLARANTLTAPTVAAVVVERVTARPHDGRLLTPEQRSALEAVATSGRTVDLLVGPAGAGKTTAMRALLLAWTAQHGRGSVVGLAPSAAAAQVLADDLGIGCDNTAKWLFEHDHARAAFHPGQLVIVDEATLASTATLDRITSLAQRAGAKVLLVGDWAQLQSVDAGGAFSLLTSARPDVPELTEVHRFTRDWEKAASLALRDGRPGVVATYAARDRLRDGSTEEMVDAAYAAWSADLAAGRSALLVTDAGDTVRALNERARAERLHTGQTSAGRDVELAGQVRASAGDLVITRRNDRTLRTATGSWVRNGDRWTITAVHRDGAVEVRREPRPTVRRDVRDVAGGDVPSGAGGELGGLRERRGAGRVRGAVGPWGRRARDGRRSGGRVVLPAAYVAAHVDLGYAVTAHRAQGMTVDRAHVLVTGASTRENLYVAMTRGRDTNTAYVALDRPDDLHVPPPVGEADATTVLAGVLQRSGRELSAHETTTAEQDTWGGIAQLAAEYETIAADASRPRHEALVRAALASGGLTPGEVEAALGSDAFGPLAAELRRIEAAGLDPATVLTAAVGQRTLLDADDITAVLHHRIHRTLAARIDTARTSTDGTGGRGKDLIVGLIPPVVGPVTDDGRRALDDRRALLETRARDLADHAIRTGAPWARALGRPPAFADAHQTWVRQVQIVAAYRDRHAVTDDDPLGPHLATLTQRRDAALAAAAIHRANNLTTPPDDDGLDPVGTGLALA